MTNIEQFILSHSETMTMTDAQIAEAINALGPLLRAPAKIADLQAAAYTSDAMVAINLAADNPDTPAQLRAACRAVLGLFGAKFETINLDSPATQTMLAIFSKAGVLTAEQVAALQAAGDVQEPSFAQRHGLGTVNAEQVAEARKRIDAQAAETARLEAWRNLRLDLLAWLQAQQESGSAAPSLAQMIGG